NSSAVPVNTPLSAYGSQYEKTTNAVASSLRAARRVRILAARLSDRYGGWVARRNSPLSWLVRSPPAPQTARANCERTDAPARASDPKETFECRKRLHRKR